MLNRDRTAGRFILRFISMYLFTFFFIFITLLYGGEFLTNADVFFKYSHAIFDTINPIFFSKELFVAIHSAIFIALLLSWIFPFMYLFGYFRTEDSDRYIGKALLLSFIYIGLILLPFLYFSEEHQISRWGNCVIPINKCNFEHTNAPLNQ